MSATGPQDRSHQPTIPQSAARGSSAARGEPAELGEATGPCPSFELSGGGTPTIDWPRRALEEAPDWTGSRSLEQPIRLGPYRLEGIIGQGGMARIFRAVDERSGRPVALKQLEGGRSRDAVARFVAEARALQRFDHPNVVRIHELVEHGPGAPYYAMEILAGSDLATILAREGRLESGRALRIGAQLCEALAHVHAAGFVHRDLKPANVFVAVGDDGAETVKLLDFGIASSRHDPGLHEGFSGTPQYTAPEQLLGAATDQRVDIYSLGVILYEMLTGTQPYRARTLAEAALRHLGSAPPPASERLGEHLPAAIDLLVSRCLAHAPSARPANADVVGSEISGLLCQRRSSRRHRAARRWARRALAPAAIAAAALLALASVHALTARQGRPGRAAPPAAAIAVEVPGGPVGQPSGPGRP